MSLVRLGGVVSVRVEPVDAVQDRGREKLDAARRPLVHQVVDEVVEPPHGLDATDPWVRRGASAGARPGSVPTRG
ncbi:hypothetical protein [Pseudonocardia sp. T1-2H]|uniref:hypothetical protein n=1 Tax=Pseudonocardia sp. T1-2H TaxID=3128899 RepID=UPI003101523E